MEHENLMLRESHPWKCELKKLKAQLVRIASAPLDHEDFEVERPLLYSAIVVRRLIESWKVTDATRARKYAVQTYPSQPERKDVLVRLTMRGEIDVEFDLNAPRAGSMDAWGIASELLHSGFVNWELDEPSCFVAIYLASKRNQAMRLVRLPVSEYFLLLDSIIDDHVTASKSSVDKNGKLTIQLS
jgi:hypothetical protein